MFQICLPPKICAPFFFYSCRWVAEQRGNFEIKQAGKVVGGTNTKRRKMFQTSKISFFLQRYRFRMKIYSIYKLQCYYLKILQMQLEQRANMNSIGTLLFVYLFLEIVSPLEQQFYLVFPIPLISQSFLTSYDARAGLQWDYISTCL